MFSTKYQFWCLTITTVPITHFSCVPGLIFSFYEYFMKILFYLSFRCTPRIHNSRVEVASSLEIWYNGGLVIIDFSLFRHVLFSFFIFSEVPALVLKNTFRLYCKHTDSSGPVITAPQFFFLNSEWNDASLETNSCKHCEKRFNICHNFIKLLYRFK